VEARVPRRDQLKVIPEPRARVLVERDAEGRGALRQRFVKLAA
jgi:hypothetical protein